MSKRKKEYATDVLKREIEENATCKKSLQVSRSDIKKMVKLEWFQYCANGWRANINSGQITITKENVYEIYFEDYKIHSAISLEQAQALAKAWVVNFICSALGVEE